ncbi:hypothetical protein GPALN_010198 [Globodera pallida]|nr:hypothetical protein GPALN_010198 [Globodera pallida]
MVQKETTSLKLDDRVRRSVTEHATLHTDATHIVGTLTVGALIAAIVTVDDQQFMEKAEKGHVFEQPPFVHFGAGPQQPPQRAYPNAKVGAVVQAKRLPG